MTTREQKAEDYRLGIIQMNEDYKNGKLKLSYAAYLKRYNRKAGVLKRMMRPATISEMISDFGAKSIRKKDMCGVYTYVGKNFTVDFCEAECETKWWEACTYDDGVLESVYDHYFEYNSFQTKADLMQDLLALDVEMEEKKNK